MDVHPSMGNQELSIELFRRHVLSHPNQVGLLIVTRELGVPASGLCVPFDFDPSSSRGSVQSIDWCLFPFRDGSLDRSYPADTLTGLRQLWFGCSEKVHRGGTYARHMLFSLLPEGGCPGHQCVGLTPELTLCTHPAHGQWLTLAELRALYPRGLKRRRPTDTVVEQAILDGWRRMQRCHLPPLDYYDDSVDELSSIALRIQELRQYMEQDCRSDTGKPWRLTSYAVALHQYYQKLGPFSEAQRRQYGLHTSMSRRQYKRVHDLVQRYPRLRDYSLFAVLRDSGEKLDRYLATKPRQASFWRGEVE